MKTIVPYVGEVRYAVCEPLLGKDVTFEDVSASDESYWQLFDELWRKAQTFAIIEHDVVVRPDTLDELEGCEHDWCAFTIPYVGQEYAGLGCAKFTSELIARVPDALAQVAGIPGDATHPPRHWCRLDAWLQGVLEQAGERKHVHGPPLGHRDGEEEYIRPSHGCW